MKKMMGMILSLTLIFNLTACGNAGTAAGTTSASVPETAASSKRTETAEKEDKKILVVYYSATGHTQKVADYIADITGADLFELEPAEPYTSGDLNWSNEDSRVSREHDNPNEREVALVSAAAENWDSYDIILAGYPIWWGIAAWPMDGFIKANDFTGKTVIPFCTSSSSGLGESGKLLAELAGTGDWLEGERFSSSVSESDVREWLAGLGL